MPATDLPAAQPLLRGDGFGFWFLVFYATTQLATPLQQRRIQVVRSNKVARKRLTESNSTPAMDLFFWVLVCYAITQLATPLHQRRIQVLVFFGFFVCYADTQLATQLPQRRIQVVRSNKVARKRLTESNGTPAMDFGYEEKRKRRYTQTKNRTKYTNKIVI